MPVLKRSSWEHFASGLAKGLSQAQAAIQAGFSENGVDAMACRLAKRPEIKARVEELRSRGNQVAITTVGISRAWLLEQLMFNVQEARTGKQYGVVNNTLMNIGRVSGIYSEKTEIDWFKKWDGDPKTLTDDQLDQVQFLLDVATIGTDKARLHAAQRRAKSLGQTVEVQAQQQIGAKQETPAESAQQPQEDW